MILKEICKLVEGRVACCEEQFDKRVEYGFASDLMSDVLTLKTNNVVLITGLSNIQAIRTAEMSDISFVILCRGRSATPEMVEVAHENNIVIIETGFSVFKCSGVLYSAGLKSIY